jgi:hypothetical protein
MRVVSLLLGFAVAIQAAPRAEQDVKVEIDNRWVRVTRESQAPRAATAMADHSASIVVYLTNARQRLIGPDGKIGEFRKKPGEVAYIERGRYSLENASSTALRSIVIELKDGAPHAETSPVTLDPVKLDPMHHLVPFENSRIRVLRTILEPHLKSPLHQHPHYVVVYITELHTTQTLPDGKVVDNPRKAGEVAWRDALEHVTENIGIRTAEEIQIELK